MNDITKKNIGRRINNVLAQDGIMQKELAEHLGVTANTVSYYLSGERCPDIDKLIEISKYLNVSTDYLLGLSDVKSTNIELKAVCDYIGLSEIAVNKLHFYNKSNMINSEKVSAFIAPDLGAKYYYSVLSVANMLESYEKRYINIIEKMNDLVKEKEELPDIVFAESIFDDILEEERFVKLSYYETVDTLRKILDGYIDDMIKTPEREEIYRKFRQIVEDQLDIMFWSE